MLVHPLDAALHRLEARSALMTSMPWKTLLRALERLAMSSLSLSRLLCRWSTSTPLVSSRNTLTRLASSSLLRIHVKGLKHVSWVI